MSTRRIITLIVSAVVVGFILGSFGVADARNTSAKPTAAPVQATSMPCATGAQACDPAAAASGACADCPKGAAVSKTDCADCPKGAPVPAGAACADCPKP
jgi:hypothetical protein